MPSIVDLAPAAGWDEREAHDLYGVRFDGHEPLRPLVDHDLDARRAGRCRVRGNDAYQVAVGPIHAGVIESGHFRFHVVGDRILHLDARLFYKHRGLERAAEGKHARRRGSPTSRAPAPPARSRTASPTPTPARRRSGSRRPPSSPAHARSCSSSSARGATSTTSPPSAPASASPRATTSFAALTERARRLNAVADRPSLPLRHASASAAARSRSTPTPCARAREELAAIRADDGARLARAPLQRLVPGPAPGHRRRRRRRRRAARHRRAGRTRSRARRRRPRGAARASPTTASSPSSRARRRRRPGPARAARARAAGRRSTSSSGCSTGPFSPAGRGGRCAESSRSAIGRVESPRGATICIVERNGDRIDRLRLRTGSYANWPVGRLRRRRQPAPRLPAHQQELRALLRLRRPLMLTLLRDLRRLRRDDRPPAHPTAAAASRSATSTPAPATAASTS